MKSGSEVTIVPPCASARETAAASPIETRNFARSLARDSAPSAVRGSMWIGGAPDAASCAAVPLDRRAAGACEGPRSNSRRRGGPGYVPGRRGGCPLPFGTLLPPGGSTGRRWRPGPTPYSRSTSLRWSSINSSTRDPVRWARMPHAASMGSFDVADRAFTILGFCRMPTSYSARRASSKGQRWRTGATAAARGRRGRGGA